MPHRPTITLFRHQASYVARFSDAVVLETFGQDTLPTAFTSDADPLAVLRLFARDHPEADVVLAPASASTARHGPSESWEWRDAEVWGRPLPN